MLPSHLGNCFNGVYFSGMRLCKETTNLKFLRSVDYHKINPR